MFGDSAALDGYAETLFGVQPCLHAEHTDGWLAAYGEWKGEAEVVPLLDGSGGYDELTGLVGVPATLNPLLVGSGGYLNSAGTSPFGVGIVKDLCAGKMPSPGRGSGEAVSLETSTCAFRAILWLLISSNPCLATLRGVCGGCVSAGALDSEVGGCGNGCGVGNRGVVGTSKKSGNVPLCFRNSGGNGCFRDGECQRKAGA
jgi:hypothetical protein